MATAGRWRCAGAAELDAPARDGETEIHIVADLPAGSADALAIADPYRRRWTVGAAFGELATCLDGEVARLGHPKAASFAFGVALVSHDVPGVAEAALRGRRRRGGGGGLGVRHGRRDRRDAPRDEIAIPAASGRYSGDAGPGLGDPEGLAARVRLSKSSRNHRRGRGVPAGAGERAKDRSRLDGEVVSKAARAYITPPSGAWP